MNVGVLRLGFAVFWLVMAGVFYFQQDALLRLGANPQTLNLGAALALVLAIWQLVRWSIGSRKSPNQTHQPTHRRPLEPRDEERPDEYNPELDFNRPRQ